MDNTETEMVTTIEMTLIEGIGHHLRFSGRIGVRRESISVGPWAWKKWNKQKQSWHCA